MASFLRHNVSDDDGDDDDDDDGVVAAAAAAAVNIKLRSVTRLQVLPLQEGARKCTGNFLIIRSTDTRTNRPTQNHTLIGVGECSAAHIRSDAKHNST